jgi:hypothetical protein
VSVFLCGSFIKLFELSSGNDADVFRVVVIMICFNFSVVTLYVIIAAYHMSKIEALPSILLKATREPPSLALPHKDHKFHLFLSHVWSSGQVPFSPRTTAPGLTHRDSPFVMRWVALLVRIKWRRSSASSCSCCTARTSSWMSVG